MQNLRETHQKNFYAERSLGPDVRLLAATWDGFNEGLLCVYCDKDTPADLRLGRLKCGSVQEVVSWNGPIYGIVVINLHYFADTRSTCLICADGDVLLIQEGHENTVEAVGHIETGVAAASWSPDEDILGLVPSAKSLVLMSRTLDPIQETPFLFEDLNISRHVSVGWGRSETQFKGKRANVLKDPTIPDELDQGIPSNRDDGAVSISWRGDGSYVAVSCLENNSRRVIRILNREGKLQSVTEPVDGLEAPMSWRPAGNIIVCARKNRNDVTDVVFFERNGLQHGGFALPPSLARVQDIIWNSDSSLLALMFSDRLQLWCMDNYHWYLKQEIFWHPDNRATTPNFKWHPEQPCLFLMYSSSQIVISKFVWKATIGPLTRPNDYGIIAVADGTQLHITPLRLANIPPPMSLRRVELRGTPVDIAISPSATKAVALRRHSLDVIAWSLGTQPAMGIPDIVHEAALLEPRVIYRQIEFLDDHFICILGEDSHGESLIELLDTSNGGFLRPNRITTLLPEQRIVAFSTLNRDIIMYQNSTGGVYFYHATTEESGEVCTLPEICPWMDSIYLGEQITVVGLSESGRLFVNSEEVTASCSSFVVTDEFLIFVTKQNRLMFACLDGDLNTLSNEYSRNLENGARLVTAIPSDSSIILQMPRGNLETIYPRALVLAAIRKYIHGGDYVSAFFVCRQHRVDLNILYDLDPQSFVTHLEDFVQRVQKPEYIDLILSQLCNEDVTQTLYPEQKSHSPNRRSNPGYVQGQKINTICDHFIRLLKQRAKGTNIQNLITAYISKSPPDYDSALRLITSFANDEAREDATSHICFLADVNKLYDAALGLYDLELALAFAQRAQKDPREYLPFLQSLRGAEELRRKFLIDDSLGKSSRALASLFAMGDECFPEFQTYMVSRGLYRDAIQLSKQCEQKLEMITGLYGNHLFELGCFHEAGLGSAPYRPSIRMSAHSTAYEFANKKQLAMDAYRQGLLWKECLQIACEIGQDVKQIATDLTQALFNEKAYGDAACIQLEYLHNPSEAVRCLSHGGNFTDAMRTALLYDKPELVEQVVDPIMLDKCAETIELLDSCVHQLDAQSTRVQDLREQKDKDPLAYFEASTESDAPDNVSLAPTNASTSVSLFTRYTAVTSATAITGVSRKSSKNKRKEERKRARGKKGSVYEEEYLTNSLRRLVEKVESLRPDVECLINSLYRRKKRDNAAQLQVQFENLTLSLQKMIPRVFINDGKTENKDYELRCRACRDQSMPLVKRFEGLSML